MSSALEFMKVWQQKQITSQIPPIASLELKTVTHPMLLNFSEETGTYPTTPILMKV